MKHKLNVMKTKPEISDEEIRGYMNFDALIRKQEGLIRAGNKTALIQKIATISVATLVLAVVWFLYQGQKHNVAVSDNSIQNEIPTAEEKVISTDSIYGTKQLNQPEIVSPPALENEDANKSDSISTDKSPEIIQDNAPKDALPTEELVTSRDYEFKEAAPIDGYAALYDYFNRTLQYPAEGLKDSIQGVVTVSFIINEQGSPEKIQIENSLGVPFDRESIKMIEHMPRWNPATVNGKPIASRLAIPLTFQIKKLN